MIKKLLIVMALFALTACTLRQKDFALVDTKGYLANPDVVNDLAQDALLANRTFSLALYQQLRSDNKNIFFSPLSVQLALAMTANGAANATQIGRAHV